MTLGEGYEDWKIYPVYEVFYIEQIRSASNSITESWELLNEIVNNPEQLKNEWDRTIDLAESIVSQAGVLSRYFFPPKDFKKKNADKNRIHELRSEKLRDYYLIDEENILKDRKFRNHIEHFDENLDGFLNNPIAGTITPKRLFWRTTDIDNITTVFKAYVVEEFKFISLSEEIELIPVVTEIYRIYNLSIYFLDNGGRLQTFEEQN